MNRVLDRAVSRIVNSAGLDESEIERAVSSPFLLARIRAQIAAESEKQELSSFWGNLGLVSRKAIPAMGLTAAVSFGLLWYVNGNKPKSQAFSVDAYLGAGESGIDNLLFAEKRTVTGEEVLTTIVGKDEREAGK